MSKQTLELLHIIVRKHTLFSDSDGNTIREAFAFENKETMPTDSAKTRNFLERFSDEKAKPFGDIVNEAIASQGTTVETIGGELSIPGGVLEKIISHQAFPDVLPIRKMRNLIGRLNISVRRAVKGFWATLELFAHPSGDGDYAVPQTRRYGRKVFHMGASRRSYEQIKRGLEDYTACLLENSCNIPREVNNE